MKEILTQLLFAVLTICAPLATAYVRKAAAAINASTAEKIKNETIQRICCEITDAVADAVAAMNQTYVNDLKKTGSFDKAAQAKALNGAISAAIPIRLPYPHNLHHLGCRNRGISPDSPKPHCAHPPASHCRAAHIELGHLLNASSISFLAGRPHSQAPPPF